MPINLKPDPMNPNRMTPEARAEMAKSLSEFGDLGGIVINRSTGMLVGGHQRAEVLRLGDLHVDDLPQPEADGTVARGWLDYDGRRYAVRVVDWPESKARAAMEAANYHGRQGHDDEAALAALLDSIKADGYDLDAAGLAGLAESIDDAIPDGNKPIDEEAMTETENECPKCGFKW